MRKSLSTWFYNCGLGVLLEDRDKEAANLRKILSEYFKYHNEDKLYSKISRIMISHSFQQGGRRNTKNGYSLQHLPVNSKTYPIRLVE